MPDPTLGRVQDTGHAGIRQGMQSIMDSLNQNSQMAMSAIENWKQRDYAAKEAEKERVFKADEALKARTHTSEENDKKIKSDEKIAHENNKTQKYVSNNQYNASIFSSKAHTSKDWNDAMTAAVTAGQAQWELDDKGNRVTDGYGRYMIKNSSPALFQQQNTPQQPTQNPTQRH